LAYRHLPLEHQRQWHSTTGSTPRSAVVGRERG
jgi:hypothetical protein